MSVARTTDIAKELATIQPRLYGFILKRLADRMQTMEVLQQTNLVICQKADEFEDGSSFVAWAFTIARFQVMAWRKSAGRDKVIFTDSVYELLERNSEVEVVAVDQRIPLLRECLKRLRETDRELIRQRYRNGESAARIAHRLAKSIEAIYMQLTRIRQQLADCVNMGLKSEEV